MDIRIEQQDCIVFLQSLPDDSVDLIVTDPAYSGMNQHLMLGRGRIIGRYADAGAEGGKWFSEFHDDPENYRIFLKECRRVLRNNRHIYIMFDSYSLLSLGSVVREVFDVKSIIVWDKKSVGMGHYFRRRHEFILFSSKGKRPVKRRDIPDVWMIQRIHGSTYPTQKPVELFAQMVNVSAEPGFVVCDPFLGSGSAAVAALKCGCSFLGCDISTRAVQLAAERVRFFLEHKVDGFKAAKTAPYEEGPTQELFLFEKKDVY